MPNGKQRDRHSLRSTVILLLLLPLLLLFPFFPQAQQKDSIAADTVRKEVRQTVEKEVSRWQDSLKAAQIKRDVAKNGKPLDVFLQEMREQEESEKRQRYIRIGIIIVSLTALLALGLVRRKKKNT